RKRDPIQVGDMYVLFSNFVFHVNVSLKVINAQSGVRVIELSVKDRFTLLHGALNSRHRQARLTRALAL
ncbi:MAG: hypothetical protein NT095_03395, partial [Burkholderiales bacterium]|nr:hypothetical protein [Burkholderiales bacterium]